jgi:predicted transcriptional regulator
LRRFWKRGDRPIILPDAEQAVLKVLWQNGDATIREITDVLYPGGDAAHYGTVQKLLERLQGRGCAARRRQGRAHVYTATVERDDLLRDRLREAAEKLCEGSYSPLLTQLVDARSLSPEEIRTLRALVDRLDQKEE